MPLSASVFVPAHISGFFQPYYAITPERSGSRNCGPCLNLGVFTDVEVERANRASIKIHVNGKYVPDAKTTLEAVKRLQRMVHGKFKVEINHSCQVPIGAGYGASGAGSLGAVLAFSKALELNMPQERLVTAAHSAEVLCHTGLGDVGAQAIAGLVMGVKPGAPPYGKWSRVSFPPKMKLICATLGSISTKKLLPNVKFRKRTNELGGMAMRKMLIAPDLQRFISVSRDFAEKLGFLDDELRGLIKSAEKSGALGASQSMLGRSIFAFVNEKKIDLAYDSFLDVLEPASVMVADIYNKGLSALV